MQDMPQFRWDPDKERLLRREVSRGGISFADCVVAVAEGRLLDVVPHPSRPHQRLLVLNIENYAYVAPFIIEDDGTWFLKTVFPSRKYTSIYIGAAKP